MIGLFPVTGCVRERCESWILCVCVSGHENDTNQQLWPRRCFTHLWRGLDGAHNPVYRGSHTHTNACIDACKMHKKQHRFRLAAYYTHLHAHMSAYMFIYSAHLRHKRKKIKVAFNAFLIKSSFLLSVSVAGVWTNATRYCSHLRKTEAWDASSAGKTHFKWLTGQKDSLQAVWF